MIVKNQNTKSQKPFPNIYGRKPSKIVTFDGATVATADSRRQARKLRKKEAESMGLQTYQLRIVVLEQKGYEQKSNRQQSSSKTESPNRPVDQRQARKTTVQGNKSSKSGGTTPSDKSRARRSGKVGSDASKNSRNAQANASA